MPSHQQGGETGQQTVGASFQDVEQVGLPGEQHPPLAMPGRRVVEEQVGLLDRVDSVVPEAADHVSRDEEGWGEIDQ